MSKRTLITGGAGFIGSNYVARLLSRGEDVKVLDNLSRGGAERNLSWLRETYGKDSFELIQADVRDASAVKSAAQDADIIVHLAAQVAVTTSVTDPRTDFEINALGTFNVMEAARASGRAPVVVYASTNKVYGGMEDVEVVEKATRYEYGTLPYGVSEQEPLDFHSPYGCSKGTGDQYVRDYARIYGLPTVVMRQSCIYGPRQFGIEDQGWVAWFIIATVLNRPMTIYGDGKQVRDLLYIDDLLNAYDAAIQRIDITAGQVYNLGGGMVNTISVWKEFGPMLEELAGRDMPVQVGDWRPGDQKVYVSDIRKAKSQLNWSPDVSVQQGVQKLYDWVKQNQNLF
ncbi:CDP-paratose 2-epimerase [Ornatilinea apprima]|uniref:CDP-paratose 2-epimerase n=1 Tax=Ornatilinea apprima TaxID=1134406 RepID=A0A0N8GNE5_9CHLR|nr:SDR family NAD(P)-dependent oxidoreductase [Ornatilinea apprima]KPL77874.1 CDP-paratose 2-epimerase [Ornatilinea apprima]